MNLLVGIIGLLISAGIITFSINHEVFIGVLIGIAMFIFFCIGSIKEAKRIDAQNLENSITKEVTYLKVDTVYIITSENIDTTYIINYKVK